MLQVLAVLMSYSALFVLLTLLSYSKLARVDFVEDENKLAKVLAMLILVAFAGSLLITSFFVWLFDKPAYLLCRLTNYENCELLDWMIRHKIFFEIIH